MAIVPSDMTTWPSLSNENGSLVKTRESRSLLVYPNETRLTADTSYADQTDASERVRQSIAELIRSTVERPITDGYKIRVVDEVLWYVRRYNNLALGALVELISNGYIGSELAGDILKWIGEMDERASCRKRREFLENILLTTESIPIRDGANLGLAFLDDPDSVPAFRKVIERERSTEMRDLLKGTLRQLEETAGASPTTVN